MQNLKVEYFGIGYFELKTQTNRAGWNAPTNAGKEYDLRYHSSKKNWKEDNDFNEKKPYKSEFYFYLYLNFGKHVERPIIFWKGIYKAEWCIKKIKAMCTNPGMALMLSKDPKQIKAVRELSAYKVKFFGNTEIPIRELNVDEFNEHFRFAVPKDENFCMLFRRSLLNQTR